MPKVVQVPLTYPASVVYVDESGVVSTDRFFVASAVKVHRPGQFSRGMRALRNRRQYTGEFHFAGLTAGKVSRYRDLIDVVAAEDVTWAACLVDRTRHDPCREWPQRWEAQARVVAHLLCRCLKKRELVTLSMDYSHTPADVAVEDVVRDLVNDRLENLSIVTAATLDSKGCDGLQVADLIAGAVAFDARRQAGIGGTNEHKAKVVEHLKAAFGLDRFLGTSPRTHVARYRAA